MSVKENEVFIEGVKTQTIEVKVTTDSLFDTLKRKVYRFNDINFTAFVDKDDQIKVWEDDGRNNKCKELYNVTTHQEEVVRTFNALERYLKESFS